MNAGKWIVFAIAAAVMISILYRMYGKKRPKPNLELTTDQKRDQEEWAKQYESASEEEKARMLKELSDALSSRE